MDDSEWEPKKIICDNNLLSASQSHIDHVIERLRLSGISGIDFNGGLDARLLTADYAKKLATLDKAIIHTAWDNKKSEPEFRQAHHYLKTAGISAARIRVYVLIGFNDSPADALYRLQAVKDLGSYPNPMRYQPLDAKKKNEYVSPSWTDSELKKFMRYWARQSYLRGIPFDQYDHRKKQLVNVGDQLL